MKKVLLLNLSFFSITHSSDDQRLFGKINSFLRKTQSPEMFPFREEEAVEQIEELVDDHLLTKFEPTEVGFGNDDNLYNYCALIENDSMSEEGLTDRFLEDIDYLLNSPDKIANIPLPILSGASQQEALQAGVNKDSGQFSRGLIDKQAKKIFKCPECGYQTNYNSNLTVHKRRHSGEKPFKCDQCKIAFACSYSLVVHKRRHIGEKPYECAECEKKFVDFSTFKRHMSVHTGEKSYECTECQKKFPKDYSLKRHMNIHAKEKPFKCEQCPKAFADSYSCKRHMREVHKLENEKVRKRLHHEAFKKDEEDSDYLEKEEKD